MDYAHQFMKTLLIAIACTWPVLLQAEKVPDEAAGDLVGGLEAAKTTKEIKAGLLFAEDWKEFEWKGNKLLVALSSLPTSGESYIDVHGYLYNRSFKEWRRFCVVKTRNVGWAEIGLDEENEELYLLAKANTPMKGKRVFRYSLLLLSDDRGYVHPDKQDDRARPAGDPAPDPADAGKPEH